MQALDGHDEPVCAAVHPVEFPKMALCVLAVAMKADEHWRRPWRVGRGRSNEVAPKGDGFDGLDLGGTRLWSHSCILVVYAKS